MFICYKYHLLCQKRIVMSNQNHPIFMQQNNMIAKHLHLYYLILVALLVEINCISSQTPTWLSSTYFRGADQALITSSTGNSSAPSFSFTYSSPFGSTPQIAYGVKRYTGQDRLGTQAFRINRLSVNANTFAVQVQIQGTTTVLYLTVAYIAVDPDFPHHLNSFDNVPLNFSGALNNINVNGSTTRTHTQNVNYGVQASTRTDKTFSTPLSNNKVLLFVSTIHVEAHYGGTSFPFIYTNSYSILNTSHYSMSASINSNHVIIRLHFSQIIFDYQDIISSNLYEVIALSSRVPTAQTLVNVPGAFQTNFMMGLSSFEAPEGRARIYYEWQFISASSQVRVLSSATPGDSPLSWKVSIIFYIKKWQCPTTHPFYNITTQLCQDSCANYHLGSLALETCVACHYSCLQCTGTSSNQCSNCDSTIDRRYLDSSSCRCIAGYGEPYSASSVCSDCTSQVGNCKTCTFGASNNVLCTECANGYFPSTPTSCVACSTGNTGCQLCANDGTCTQCNTASGYFLDQNPSSATYQDCVACSTLIFNCGTCVTYKYCAVCVGPNYFAFENPTDSTVSTCVACTLTGCTLCSSLTQCTTCDNSANYYLDTNSASPTYQTCITCPLTGCTLCSSLTQCTTCDNSANYYLDTNSASPTYQTCITCPLTGCTLCSSLTQCATCDNSANYYLDTDSSSPTYQTCILCSLTGCTLCSTLTQCTTCDNSANYYLDTDSSSPTYQTCILCSLTGCTLCSSSTQCTTCDNSANYYLDTDSSSPTYQTCLLCSLTGCLLCTNSIQCNTCDNSANYFLDTIITSPTFLQCITCSLNQCALCSSLTQCTTCNSAAGYFRDQVSSSPTYETCLPCSLNWCTTCLSLTRCSICDNSVQKFLDTSSSSPTFETCIGCSLTGCTSCISLTQCNTCDNSANYFLDTVSSSPTFGTCILCSMTGCTLCSSLTTCITCDNSAQFYLDTVSSSPTFETCISCPVPRCTQCLSLTQCLTCDNSINYFLDANAASPTYQTCILCSLPGCTICSSLTQCSTCDNSANYFLDSDNTSPTYQTCILCTIPNCITCADLSICQNCDTVNDYFKVTDISDPNYGQCLACTLSNCNDCTNATYCTSCNAQFFVSQYDNTLPQYGTCVICQNWLPNCNTCLNDNFCSQCNAGYYRNNDNTAPTYGSCQACTIVNCDICLNGTYCSQCAINHFTVVDLSDSDYGKCQSCSISYCLLCQNLTYCQTCDTSAGYHIDFQSTSATYGECIACPIANCITCDNITHCLVCDNANNFYLDEDPTSATYGQCIICSALPSLSNCLVCQNKTACDTCDTSIHYHLNLGTYFCELCVLSNCLICESLTQCQTCDTSSGFFLNNTNKQCEACSLTGCLTCATLTTCSVCDASNAYSLTSTLKCDKCWANCNCNGFTLPKKANGDCSVTCGDGLKRGDQECDDGNTVNDDGCTSECIIQQNWQCSNQAQCCQVSTQLLITPVSIQKQLIENKVNITLHIQPWLPIYCQKSSKIFVLPNFVSISEKNSGKATSLKAQALSCNDQEQSISILFNYNKSQHKKEITITIIPNLPPSSTNCSPAPVNASLSFIMQSDNNLPIIPFSQQQYEAAKVAQSVVLAVQVGSYTVMALSTLSCKIVGLQLFGVLQLAFFTLADNDEVNIMLSSFLDAKYLNGFNMKFSNQSNKEKRTSSAKLKKLLKSQSGRVLKSQTLLSQINEVPSRVNALGFQSPLFIDNCNIMLGVIFGQILIAFILYLVTKCLQGTKFKTIYKIAKFLMQDIFLTLILFNCFNIAFSASIHFTYSSGDQELYLISTILAIASLMIPVVMIFALMCADSKQFGEFKNKFKKDCPSQTYFSIIIIYRVGLGMYVGAMNEFETSTIIATFFSIAILMYTLINLPFKDAYQNYRAVFCNATTMVVLFVTMYYRSMKSNIQAQERAIILVPAIIQLAAIAFCMVFSIIVLFYEIYVFIRNCCTNKKNNASQKIANEFFNQKIQKKETEYSFKYDSSLANLSQNDLQKQRPKNKTNNPDVIFQEEQANQKKTYGKQSIDLADIEYDLHFEDL